jgi:hypothetical protein
MIARLLGSQLDNLLPRLPQHLASAEVADLTRALQKKTVYMKL